MSHAISLRLFAITGLHAIREYETECNKKRREESLRVYGHTGASIPSCAPTDDGRIAAMEAAMEKAARA